MAHPAVLRYEDLETFPDDNLRREILDGVLNVTPSPVPRHQRVVLEILRVLDDYAKEKGDEVYVSPIDVVLSAQNVVVPDIVYVAADRLHTLGEKAILGVPTLFVEVVSPSTQYIDRGKKRALYARFALPEYWIVDLNANTIERCSDPAGDQFRTVERFECAMPAATLPGFVLPFEKVFR